MGEWVRTEGHGFRKLGVEVVHDDLAAANLHPPTLCTTFKDDNLERENEDSASGRFYGRRRARRSVGDYEKSTSFRLQPAYDISTFNGISGWKRKEAFENQNDRGEGGT